MKVPRRSRVPRPAERSRVRPADGRGGSRPARRAVRGRVPAAEVPEEEPVALLEVRNSPFTRRAAVFASVLVLTAFSVAFPAQRYLAQRKHVAELRAKESADAAQVAALERETALRTQNFYVEREARVRLHYVKPGEAALRVSDPPPLPGTPGAAADVAAATWWGRLMQSVATAATPVERLPAGVRRDAPVAR
jgi:cell division protein FtsB